MDGGWIEKSLTGANLLKIYVRDHRDPPALSICRPCIFVFGDFFRQASKGGETTRIRERRKCTRHGCWIVSASSQTKNSGRLQSEWIPSDHFLHVSLSHCVVISIPGISLSSPLEFLCNLFFVLRAEIYSCFLAFFVRLFDSCRKRKKRKFDSAKTDRKRLGFPYFPRVLHKIQQNLEE